MLLLSREWEHGLLVSLLLGCTGAQTAYQSIYTVDAFAAQPICVQACFTAGYDNINCYTDVLGSLLGCPNTPCATAFAAVDSCYCRGDLQAAASQLLGLCINEVCSVGDNSINLATAVGIYSSYCQERGFTAAPASATSLAGSETKSGTAASTIPNIPSGATMTSTPTTNPSGTTLPSATSSGNNTLIIVAASVGTLLGVVIFLAAIFCWMRWSRPSQSPVRPCLNHDALENSAKPWGSQLSEPSSSESASQVGFTPANDPGFVSYPEPSMVGTDISRSQQWAAGLGQGQSRTPR